MDKWLIGLKPVYEGLWWCLQRVDGAGRTTVRAPWNPVEDGNQLHSHTYTCIYLCPSLCVIFPLDQTVTCVYGWGLNILLHSQEVFMCPCLCDTVETCGLNRMWSRTQQTGYDRLLLSARLRARACVRACLCVPSSFLSLPSVCGGINLRPKKDCSLPPEKGKKGE